MTTPKNSHKTSEDDLTQCAKAFALEAGPLEWPDKLVLFVDSMTKAHYCECHIKASKLVALATTDVPLDPEEQPEYRANREIVGDHHAFQKMKEDALRGRTFSNIVAEYTKAFDPDHPIKIIGGQHRFEAIKGALEEKVDQYHSVKVYMLLNKEQRLDVQLISNTNIAVSADLFDRMQETMRGPHLRDWCQEVGLLQPGQDFADKAARGGPITVRMARTFLTSYCLGRMVDPTKFNLTDTQPVLCPSGQHDTDWDKLNSEHSDLWTDPKLKKAAKEFAELVKAQRAAFAAGRNPRAKPDYPEKALNAAILSAWSYVAGILHNNETRIQRHYALRCATGKDPLNAQALGKGRHKSDSDTYRGLGYRTDYKERGRFVELFYYQAEKGCGITPTAIDIAIKQYHAKQAQLEVIKAKED